MKKLFHLPRILLSSNKGLSLIEVLVVSFFSVIIMGVLSYLLIAGESANSASAVRSELQAEVRRAVDWITRDARQAVTWELAQNTPSGIHIKFKMVQGWSGGALQLSDYFIEYTYDSNTGVITRKKIDVATGDLLQSWVINNIISEPFYTRDTSDNVVALNADDLRSCGKLIVDIDGRKLIKGSTYFDYSLTAEIKVRNE